MTDDDRLVLGAMLLSERLTRRVAELDWPAQIIRTEPLQEAFVTILVLHGDGVPVDVLTVTERLRSTGRLEAAGGRDAIDALAREVPTRTDVGAAVQRIAQRTT